MLKVKYGFGFVLFPFGREGGYCLWTEEFPYNWLVIIIRDELAICTGITVHMMAGRTRGILWTRTVEIGIRQRAVRHGEESAVDFVDLLRTVVVVDEFGHLANVDETHGAEVLVEVAAQIVVLVAVLVEVVVAAEDEGRGIAANGVEEGGDL